MEGYKENQGLDDIAKVEQFYVLEPTEPIESCKAEQG